MSGHLRIAVGWFFTLVLAGCGGGGGASGAVLPAEPAATVQEAQCVAAGWQRLVVPALGRQRLALWKAPLGAWRSGAIVVLHGGGGTHTHFCVANADLIAAQVRFTTLALQQGFAVFLLDSTDEVTDNQGRLCGKVWDDELRGRPNLDLPFVDELLSRRLPSLRPAGSRPEVFVTGLSSGAFMTLRLVTALADRVTAFAPVAGGDPYGWHRDCTRRSGDRVNVAGVGLDNETLRSISEPQACEATAYPNEKPWDGQALPARPPFRVFHHAQDGVLDRSCVDKARRQLRNHGFAETAPFTLDGGGRNVDAHYWQDAYNQPILDFFSTRVARAGLP